MKKTLLLAVVCLFISACSTTTKVYVNHLESQVEQAQFSSHMLKIDQFGQHSQLHFWDNHKSNAETVVLIHGVGGDALTNWHNVMEALGQDYRIIAPDILWYGQSTSAITPTLEHQVEAIDLLLKQLNITGKVHLVGHSYGGFIVYGLLAQHDIAQSATFISSPGGAFTQADLNALLKRFDLKQPSDLFVPRSDSDLKRLANATSYSSIHAPAFVFDGVYDKYFSGNPVQKAYMLDHLIDSRQRLVDKLATQTLPPSQIIWGEQDQIFPLETGMNLSHQLHAPLSIITDSAHNILLEKPDSVIRLLRKFIGEHAHK